MNEQQIDEIEARVAKIVWPPVWREVKFVIEDYVPALIAALREARGAAVLMQDCVRLLELEHIRLHGYPFTLPGGISPELRAELEK